MSSAHWQPSGHGLNLVWILVWIFRLDEENYIYRVLRGLDFGLNLVWILVWIWSEFWNLVWILVCIWSEFDLNLVWILVWVWSGFGLNFCLNLVCVSLTWVSEPRAASYLDQYWCSLLYLVCSLDFLLVLFSSCWGGGLNVGTALHWKTILWGFGGDDLKILGNWLLPKKSLYFW